MGAVCGCGWTRRVAVLACAVAVLAGCSTDAPDLDPTPDSSPTAAAVPQVLVGSTVGGTALVIAQLDAEGSVVSVDQIGPPEQELGDATSGPAGIYAMTCCEPAAGERFVLSLDRAKYTQLGFGSTVDTRDDLLLTVHPAAGFVEIEARGGEPRLIMPRVPHWFAIDATFAPDGDIVAVATGDVEESAVFIIDPDSEHFDAGRPALEGTGLGGRLGRPAMDADGRVWLLVYRFETDQPLRRIILDVASSEITDVPGPVPVDHAFDTTGTFLVSTFPDGTTTWRRHDDTAEVELELPALDTVDW